MSVFWHDKIFFLGGGEGMGKGLKDLEAFIGQCIVSACESVLNLMKSGVPLS